MGKAQGIIIMITLLKIIAPILSAFGIAIIIYGQHLQLRQTQAELLRAEANIAALNMQIASQNSAISQWKKEGEHLEMKLRHVEHELMQQRTISQQKIAEINNEKVPKDCMGAVKWGIQKAKKI
jgi:multidrug resistance efflux pump